MIVAPSLKRRLSVKPPSFLCVFVLAGFQCDSAYHTRAVRPRQERGPRRRPSSQRPAVLPTENVKAFGSSSFVSTPPDVRRSAWLKRVLRDLFTLLFALN
jgi:hypothetical protein